MRKKMILLVLTLFIGLSACGNDDKELPDEPGKEQGGNGGDEPENPDNPSGNEPVSWYVATTGNDGNSGTLDSPLKSHCCVSIPVIRFFSGRVHTMSLSLLLVQGKKVN